LADDRQKQFVEEISKYEKLISKLVFIYADTWEEKQDLRQEILLQAWKSYSAFRGNASFSTWLYRIGFNTAMLALKKKKRNPVSAAESRPDPAHAPQAEADEKLHYIFSRLKELDRTILAMQLDGYGLQEIAGTLSLSEANVRVRLHRIRKEIKETWN
jgi:RNA polymerase sigma factor (sigma-70 family)